MKVYHTLNPIYDENSKILILGSMPSVKSRELKFYYANSQNRFWKVMENIFKIKLNTNEDKINFLLDKHIALWDTIKSCNITGSLDSTIKNIKYNNFNLIFKKARIKAIFCTGRKSYDLYLKQNKKDIPVFYLPSPSGANASSSLDKLTESYKKILDFL